MTAKGALVRPGVPSQLPSLPTKMPQNNTLQDTVSPLVTNKWFLRVQIIAHIKISFRLCREQGLISSENKLNLSRDDQESSKLGITTEVSTVAYLIYSKAEQ